MTKNWNMLFLISIYKSGKPVTENTRIRLKKQQHIYNFWNQADQTTVNTLFSSDQCLVAHHKMEQRNNIFLKNPVRNLRMRPKL